jgi:hypothetical protein
MAYAYAGIDREEDATGSVQGILLMFPESIFSHHREPVLF